MSLRIHLRPLIGPNHTNPTLLLTKEPFRVEPWLEGHLRIPKDDRVPIDHGWILTEQDGLRVQAGAIANAIGLCVHCSSGLYCAWAMEHANSLSVLPYAIPFVRDGKQGYHAEDATLLALGLRNLTLGDRAKTIKAQLASRAVGFLQDPVIEGRLRALMEQAMRETEAFAKQQFIGVTDVIMHGARSPELLRAEQTLGVSLPYTAADVKAAHRQRITQAHPDAIGGSESRAKELNLARDLLLEYLGRTAK